MTKSIVIVSDPLLNEYGSCRPTLLIAEELTKRGFMVKIVTESCVNQVRQMCEKNGISVVEIGNKPIPLSPSVSWFKSWVSEALFSQNSRKTAATGAMVLNFSNTIVVPSQFWYAQGPPTVTLDNIKGSLAWHYRLVYDFTQPFLKMLDKQTTTKFSKITKKIVANSEYLSDVYKRFGVQVHNVIYPPSDCEQFKPRKTNSSSDYVLTYFGKETKFSIVKKIADAGVKIKVFGTKMSLPPRFLRKHPNVNFLGFVSDEMLVKLYSNALITLYPFLDEPFGYIPVESMACATPVLTYNCQGPSESVVNDVTGWLVDNDQSFVDFATKIWKNGYSSSMRKDCRKRALLFDKGKIAERWVQLIEDLNCCPRVLG